MRRVERLSDDAHTRLRLRLRVVRREQAGNVKGIYTARASVTAYTLHLTLATQCARPSQRANFHHVKFPPTPSPPEKKRKKKTPCSFLYDASSASSYKGPMHGSATRNLPARVLGPDKVGPRLGLRPAVVVMPVAVVIMAMLVLQRADVLHLVDATALGASLNGARARELREGVLVGDQDLCAVRGKGIRTPSQCTICESAG